MSDHDDFAFEPVPGLPGHLPAGEEMIWQGRPDTADLAREAFKAHWVAFYLAAIAVLRFGFALAEGPLGQAVALALPYLILAGLSFGILYLMAYAQTRATVYTVTSARVTMRIGASLSVTLNLPYTQVTAARLDLRRSGSGTIALQLSEQAKLSYLVLWPHARPWTLRHPEPALRCIPDAARVAQTLSEAAQTRMNLPVVARVSQATPAHGTPGPATIAAE